ncbi:MAG: alpha/beta hydrolase [Clostridia bacterium]|nr:alpha/beta hydrolase [Clostridia bacterium]
MKKFTKVLGTIALSCGIGAFAYKKIGEKFYEYALSAKGIDKMRGADEIGGDVKEVIVTSDYVAQGRAWFNDSENELLHIKSSLSDEIPALLYKLPEATNRWAIVCHGYASKPSDMGVFGKIFASQGFNVILPTMRGHADSPCEYTGMGWVERLDVISLVEYIIEQDPDAQIVLFGVSMGAACVLMTTGEKLPENVVCAVADCGYTSIWDIFTVQIKNIFHLPPFPFLDAANSVFKKKSGFDLKDGSAVEQVKKSCTPTLFIHGCDDDFVPFYMLDEIYNSAACEKEKYAVENAAHAVASLVAEDEYTDRVVNFINKYLK